MIFDGSKVNLLIAFVGGLVTFFASCLLPLVPTYLAYLSGVTLSENNPKSEKHLKKSIFINGLIFTIGFIFIFVLLGAGINTFGRVFAQNRRVIQTIGGFFFVVLGLFMTGLIKPLALFKELKIKLPSNPTKWQKVNSFLVGLTFGFAWTPCIGPVLAVILFWASQAETLFQGVALLFVYGIGLGVPFLVIALGFEQLAPKLVKAKAFGKALHLISGLVIILMGFLLITGNVDAMSLTLIRIFGLDEHAI